MQVYFYFLHNYLPTAVFEYPVVDKSGMDEDEDDADDDPILEEGTYRMHVLHLYST